MRKFLFTACAAIALLSVSPAGAIAHSHRPAKIGTKIVPFKSVGGISLGITPSELRRRLGKPRHVKHLEGAIVEMTYGHGTIDNPGLAVYFDNLLRRDPADEVEGFEPRMHTPAGIHPGSSMAAVHRAYGRAGLRKRSEGLYSIIHGKPFAFGEHETDFWALDGKVYEIEVQTVFNDLR